MAGHVLKYDEALAAPSFHPTALMRRRDLT